MHTITIVYGTLQKYSTKTKVGTRVELHGRGCGIGYATLVGRRKGLIILDLNGQVVGVTQ